MSMAKLLIGVQNHLRNKLALTFKHVGVETSAQPPPRMGQFYYSVYPKGIQPYAMGEIMNGIGMSYSIGVGISVKTGLAPKDRDADEVYVKAYSGIEARSYQIIANLHQNWEAMALVNTLIGETGGIFQEWLRWGGTSVPEEVGPTWFWEDPDPGGLATTGFLLDVTFQGASKFLSLANLSAAI